MTETNTRFDCSECDREAVAVLKVRGTSRYLCRSHYRDGIRTYGEEIDEKRLLPTGVRND